jgi:hypothetical protein
MGHPLIGTPERLIGILTPMDFLRYLYQVASPFVMVSEIELALRALIRSALDPEQIAAAARRSLAAHYGGAEIQRYYRTHPLGASGSQRDTLDSQ